MRLFYPVLPVLFIVFLSACDQNGGAMPIKGRDLLSSFDGPKIPSMQENQITEAKNAEKNEDFTKASQIYQQILEKDPETTDVVQLLADSLRRSGEYDKAISVYDGLIAKDDTNILAKEGKALALIAKGDFETPTALFEDVLRVDGKRWKSLNGMGILFVTRGLYPESMKYFEEAMKQSPTNTSVMNNFGLSQALNKQYESAIGTLSKASAQSSINSSARKRIDLNLALVYASAGKLDEAKKIASLYLSGPSLNNNLGLYAHLAKDDGLAKSYLNMALTESKTYYGKAWENLETIGSKESDSETKQPSKSSAEPKKEKGKDKQKKPVEQKKAKAVDKGQGKQITITPEPPATKSEVKSLGEIMAREIKKDENGVVNTVESNKPSNQPQVVVMPNEIKSGEKRIAVENVIDDMAKDVNIKNASPSAGKPTKSTEKSLGTIKISNTKAPINKNANKEAIEPEEDDSEEK
jgi:Flp pilus assembly protein TadD